MIKENTQTDQEVITAIDTQGKFYPIGKLEAHVRNVPHLAVSVFLFNRGKLLLQQRAAGKYHSGGLWANTCCSHPRWEEPMQKCAERRLQEEVGCKCSLTSFGKIDYAAQVGELYENESAHCFVGYPQNADLPTSLNPEEVQAVRWQSLPELRQAIARNPKQYSEWMRIYMDKHYELIAGIAYGPQVLTGAMVD